MSAKEFLESSYEPAQFEHDLYQFWLKENCFYASDENAPSQESFCIVIPPPNVTGALHMGHALTNTIQDILVRWKRMSGYNTLWLPGTDHAGIATQNQVEKHLAKQGLDRHQLGREAFLKRVWEWKEEHHGRITDQLKKLGSSLDWNRERFTLDEGLSKAVRKVFVQLYEKGLIYRANRLINWCVRCQTALSDLEVVPTERSSKIYKLRYPVVDKLGKQSYVIVATTRPETLLGDAALAVHPEDPRYEVLSSDAHALVPFVHREIPIIKDEYVDQTFGSGVLKITPGHDFNDSEVAVRHQLSAISIFDKAGILTAEAKDYAGLTISQARKKIVADLDALGLIESIEDHKNQVGLCQRCDTVAEPMLSLQWFVNTKPLAERAMQVVRNGEIVFMPSNWEKTYFEWMENIRDWCISRQLWWGHQIPAWTCLKCAHVHVAETAPASCIKCNSSELIQDPDVLDTWFSSGLWPFSTLGWPDDTKALKTFYPTSILETGFDIIFFWVSRMIMLGLECTDQVPFHRVYLHAMVRDEKGEKMSKSKGNVIDPLDVTSKFGADALRFTLATMAGQGRDLKLSIDRVEGYKAFGNKVWNASKYILTNTLAEIESGKLHDPLKLSTFFDQSEDVTIKSKYFPHFWILGRLRIVAKVVDDSLDKFELDKASGELYRFIWNDLCDWFLEVSKVYMKDEASKTATQEVMLYVLDRSLKLLHPFMPFTTEQIWKSLPTSLPQNVAHRAKDGLSEVHSISLSKFPSDDLLLERANSEQPASDMIFLKAIVQGVRNFRGENNISPKIAFKIYVTKISSDSRVFLETHRELLGSLAKVEEFVFGEISSDQNSGPTALIACPEFGLTMAIKLKGLIDFGEERKRLEKELEKVDKDISHFNKKLSSPAFLEKAPVALVKQERDKILIFEQKRAEITEAMKRFATE